MPMRRPWQRVAERADKRSFTVEEVSRALEPALEQDCWDELRPDFFSRLRGVVEEPSLFRESVVAGIEAMQPEAGAGLERAVIDRVSCLCALSPADMDGLAVMKKAVRGALQNAANQRIRQVEEHYLREGSSPRAANVRNRLEGGRDCTDFAALAERILGIAPPGAPKAPLRRTGLDDGVSLR
jgi:hypothetical protein